MSSREDMYKNWKHYDRPPLFSVVEDLILLCLNQQQEIEELEDRLTKLEARVVPGEGAESA